MNGTKTQSDDSGTVDANKGTEYERATVDFYNPTGGYGFFDVSDVSVDEDVFFNTEDVTNADEINEGDVLDIKIEDFDKGPRAVDLHLVSRADDEDVEVEIGDRVEFEQDGQRHTGTVRPATDLNPDGTLVVEVETPQNFGSWKIDADDVSLLDNEGDA